MNETIYLDSVIKWRNTQEYRPVSRASWRHLESVGDGDNLKIVARLMVEEGVTGYVDVYRDKTPVFLGVPIEDMVKGSIGRGPQPEHLRKTNADTDADPRQQP